MATAKQRYAVLQSQRTSILERARDCAKLTIPSLMPPSGHSAPSRLPAPWQTLGARCVNTLANKLLLALFPPGSSFFKFNLDGKAKAQADANARQATGESTPQGPIDEGLSKIEQIILRDMETSAARTQLFSALRQLIASGNILLHVPNEGPFRAFRLDRYVVRRDPMGTLLETIVCETVAPASLPEEVRTLAGAKASDEKTLELYTHIQWDGTAWREYQEIEGKQIPGTQSTYPKGKCPWLALRLIALDNEDYGRGLVEEYLGDFRSLEALSKAIVQGTAAAAKVVFLVNPNGTTDARVISKSETGDVRDGRADDVTTMKVDKGADFTVALNTIKGIADALSYAFLLNSAIQRNGERVTAEEIRYMAQELEAGLGGIYSNLSQDLQLPLVTLLWHRNTKNGSIPQLPKGMVRPTIVTGLDALGRGQDRSRLTGLLQTLQAFDPNIAQKLKIGELVKRLAAADGVDVTGLIKSDAEIAQEQQQAQMQAMIEKLGPNAINQMGALAKHSTPQAAPESQPQGPQ